MSGPREPDRSFRSDQHVGLFFFFLFPRCFFYPLIIISFLLLPDNRRSASSIGRVALIPLPVHQRQSRGSVRQFHRSWVSQPCTSRTKLPEQSPLPFSGRNYRHYMYTRIGRANERIYGGLCVQGENNVDASVFSFLFIYFYVHYTCMFFMTPSFVARSPSVRRTRAIMRY